VLEQVIVGCTNAAIGRALDISEQTVKNHMTSILAKMGADDRTEAAVKYLAGAANWLPVLYRSEERLLAIRRDIDLALSAIRALQAHTRETPFRGH
jgi:hypothetical protein